MVPEHYSQWAATIEKLSPEEQARVLGQLPEEDRLVVQRIIDQSAIGRSSRAHAPSPARPGPASEREAGMTRPPRAAQTVGQSPSRRPPQRTRSAEPLPHVEEFQQEDGFEQTRRSSSYNLGTQSPDRGNYEHEGATASSPEAAPKQAVPVARTRAPSEPAAIQQQDEGSRQQQHQAQADLLGMFGGESAGAAVQNESKKGVQHTGQHDSADLLGVSNAVCPDKQPDRKVSPADIFDTSAPEAQASSKHASQGRDDDDILGVFSTPPQPAKPSANQPAAAHSNTAASGLDELFGGQPASAHRAGESMIDFGDEAGGLAAARMQFTAAGDVDVEGEPEVKYLQPNQSSHIPSF